MIFVTPNLSFEYEKRYAMAEFPQFLDGALWGGANPIGAQRIKGTNCLQLYKRLFC